MNLLRGGQTVGEVMTVSHVNPSLRPRLESLPIELKNEILARNVNLDNLNDLISVLEMIVAEEEAAH